MSTVLGMDAPIKWMPRSEMIPDAGPLEMYRNVFPHHDVRWNTPRQCWEVFSRHPGTGKETRVALLRGPSGEYVPFDYRWVRHQLLQRQRRLEVGDVGLINEIADRNNALSTKRLKAVQDAKDDFAKDNRRWLPALAEAHRPDRKWAYSSELTSEVSPLVSPGINLKEP